MSKLNITTVDINNKDLTYTIDTYGMFTGEGIEEQEIEYYKDEYNLTDSEAQDLEFDYNHPEVVKQLAIESVGLLSHNLVTHGDGVIIGIDLVDTKSPQFYNYTTDSYLATWSVNLTKLVEYINRDTAKFGTFVSDEWRESINVPKQITPEYLENSDSDLLVMAIDYYTRNEYDQEDYESHMFEYEGEAWSNNTNLTDESQKLIDSKRSN